MDYLTSSGAQYSFSGWNPGESPLECWDDKEWLKCLHACMFCLSMIKASQMALQAIEDDGLLHELVHLADGVDICTHGSMAALREKVIALQCSFETIRRIYYD